MGSDYSDDLFVCNCHLPDHCFIIRQWHWGGDISDDYPPELSISVGLTEYKGFFKRLLAAIKYVFKPRKNHYLFEEVLVKDEDLDRLIAIFQKQKEDVKKLGK